jgi:hypothetical protein
MYLVVEGISNECSKTMVVSWYIVVCDVFPNNVDAV